MLNPMAFRSTLSALAVITIAASSVAGQSARRLTERLDSIAGVGVTAGRGLGMVAAVVRDRDTLLLRAYGKANVEWDVPMTVGAMFEVGSIAKQFTAAAILQLRDAGRLELDDDITKWLPELDTGGRAVTLRHLLSHTSGIFRFDDTPDWEINYLAPRLPRDAARDMIALEPFLFEPGQAQAYSNGGFWLLGLVVERVSGLSLEQYLQQRIFEPLGMTRSMYCNSMLNVPQRAHGYGLVNGVIRRAPMVNYTWVFAPGAVCSTARDLVTWLQALHGGKVLSPESYAEMTRPATLADGTTVQYGLGIKVGTDHLGSRYIGHGGTAPGFRADATWYPDANLAVVVLVNTSPSNIAPSAVGHALAGAVMGESRQALEPFTGDAAPYIGTYDYALGGNRGGFTIEVSRAPTGLAFSLNGSPPEVLPWAGGSTFYASETVTLTFRRANGETGPVTELRRDDAGNHYILRKR